MAFDNVVPIDEGAARLLARRKIRFRWFVALLALAYVGVLVPTLLLTPLPPLVPFVSLAILVVLAEHRFVLFGDETSMSASIIVVVASVFVFSDSAPLAGPLLIGSLGGLYLPHLRRGCRHKAVFNSTGMGLAAVTAASVGLAARGVADGPFVALGIVSGVALVYWWTNNAVVAGYLTATNGNPFGAMCRSLFTSEVEVLLWVGAACIATEMAAERTLVEIALIASVTALRVAVGSPLSGSATKDSGSERPRRNKPRLTNVHHHVLAGWIAAMAFVLFVGTPRECDIAFALVVVLLVERHKIPTQGVAALGLPLGAIATLTAPLPIPILISVSCTALLLIRPRSRFAWSACVTIGATMWIVLDPILAQPLWDERPLTVCIALLLPAVVALVLYGVRTCCLAGSLDPWVLVGFITPTKSDWVAASAIGLVAVTLAHSANLYTVLTRSAG